MKRAESQVTKRSVMKTSGETACGSASLTLCRHLRFHMTPLVAGGMQLAVAGTTYLYALVILLRIAYRTSAANESRPSLRVMDAR